ncbi:MAG: hydrogenase maturation protease [Mycobacteriaceae bacterium]
MTGPVVIGIGNSFRRDDGVGPAVAAELIACDLGGVRVVTCATEPAALLDAWDGAALAVLVDAVVGDEPGRVRRCSLDDLADAVQVSSHDLSVRQAYDLSRVLGRAPQSVVVVTVDAADTGHGQGLSPAVASALPHAVEAVLRVLVEQTDKAGHQQS